MQRQCLVASDSPYEVPTEDEKGVDWSEKKGKRDKNEEKNNNGCAGVICM